MKTTFRLILLFAFVLSAQHIFAQTGCTGDCENGYGVYQFDGGDKYEGNWLIVEIELSSGILDDWYVHASVYSAEDL